MSTPAVAIRIGPELHGTHMSLDDFAYAESVPGYLYELERGVIVVDVPRIPHEFAVQAVRDALVQYRLAHSGRVVLISGGTGSVLRLPGFQSERHPDITVYLTRPPEPDQGQAWNEWTPDLVVEVVSKSSVKRDYHIKREEYLAGGVREYWIVDPLTRVALALTRRGDVWHEERLDAAKTLTSTQLPGFGLPVSDVFAAA